jgi:hypothetical protein
VQSEQGYLSQDKLALLFIRDQTVGHATLNIQHSAFIQEIYCKQLFAIVQVGIHCTYILHRTINIYIKDT